MVRTPAKTLTPEARRRQLWHRVAVVGANLLCGLWISLCLAYISQTVGIEKLFHLTPPELGVMLLGLASVPGIIWVTLGHFAGMRTLAQANRSMARHFRDFTKFSVGERQEIAESSEAARRESLSLFEAAQASLAALSQIQGSLKQNTTALIEAAGQSTLAIGTAGAQMEERAIAVRNLTGQFHANSTELQKRAGDAVAALEAVMARMEQSQDGLADKTIQLDAAADRTVSRLHLSGEAIHVTLSSLGDAASMLDVRRDQIQRTSDDVVVKLQGASNKLASDLQTIEDTASNALTAKQDQIIRASEEAASHLQAANARLADELQALDEKVNATLESKRAAILAMSEEAAAQLQQAKDRLAEELRALDESGTTALESRRAELVRASEAAIANLQATGDRIASELRTIDETAYASADVLTSAARQAVDQLSENAAILSDYMRDVEDVSAKLSSNASALATAGQGHIGALQAAASMVADTAQKVSQTFSGQVGDITSLSNDAAQRLEQAAGRIHAGLDGIRSNIAETSGSVDRFAEVGDRMYRYRAETEENLNSILQRLDDLATRFQGEIGSANEVERVIQHVANTVSEGLGRIRGEQEATSRELEAFGERSQGLSMRLEGLRVAAVKGTADIAGAADRLQHRSESLTDELKGQAMTFNDALNRADTIAGTVKSTATMIDQTIGLASDAARSMREGFQAVTHDMETERGRMQQEASMAVETLSQAKSRMEDSIAQINVILGGLDSKAGDINFTVSSSISRLGELTHGLERAREEVLGSSDRAAEHIGNATSNLYATADRIREAADHVSGVANHAGDVGNSLAGKGYELRDRVAEIAHSAQEASNSLQATTDGLSHSAARTKEQLENISREVRQENEAIINTLSRIATVEGALRNAGAMVDEIVANAERAVASAATEMHSAGREIALQSKVLVETSGSNNAILGRVRGEMESVVVQVQDSFGTLNQKAGEINFVVSTAVNRLGELARGLEAAQIVVGGATDGASEKLSGMAQSMRAEFGTVHEVADRALAQLERTLSAVAATSANLDSETQTIEQRIAATFRAAEEGSQQLHDKVGSTIEQIQRAEQAFVDGQSRLAGTAEDSTAHLLRLTAALASGGSEIGNAAIITGERIASASAVVESRLQSINLIADQVRSAIGAFASDLGEASQQTDAFTQALTDRGNVLRDNVVQIARTTEETIDTVKSSTGTLIASAIEISDTAGRTRTEIARVAAELKREGIAISEAEAQSRAMAAQVAALLGERAMELAQTARKVAAETVTMRETNAKFQRETFLSAANTVLHALTSLSVDISRVLDTDLPEELRLELVRGDIPAFVRRLAAMRDTVSTPKLRAKFATDTRFRTHVQTYLGEFEGLLGQASKVDQGAVLSATLVSSDIGKIYTYLSAAIGTGEDELQQTA